MYIIDEFRFKCGHFWANSHPFLRFLVLVLVLGSVLLFILVPGCRLTKSAVAKKNVAAADQALKEGEMMAARDFSLSAIQSGETSIKAYRILEESMSALRDPRHAGVARAMILRPEATEDDRLRAFVSIAPEMPMGLLGASWLMLPEECRMDAGFVAPFADRLIAEKLYNKASSVLQGVPEAYRTDAIQQRLIRLMIQTGEPAMQNEAQRWLSSKWPDHTEELDGWLDLVEQIPIAELSPHLLDSVRWKLEGPEFEGSARHHLVLARIRYVADFPNRDQVLSQAVATWKDQAPESVAKLLVDTQNDKRLIQMLTPEVFTEHPKLFLVLLDALGRSGDAELIKALLESQVDLLPKYESLARLAVLSTKLGDESARLEYWKAALNDAKFSVNTDSLLVLHRLAEAADMMPEAEEAMVEAILRGRGPLPFFEQIHWLIDNLARKGLEELILRILTTYLWFEPGDHNLVAGYIYLACFNDLAEPEVLLRAVTLLATEFPEHRNIQFTHAVAYLYSGQASAAAEVLNRMELDPNVLPPSQRAILFTTRVLNQAMTPQDRLIADFPWKSVLPSERKKCIAWLKQAEK
jgi:hypothetical protein